jgi:prevent-host-death family protein
MRHPSTTEARDNLAELINRVAYGHERVVLERRGKKVAALVSVEDLTRLEALDDADDVAAAREALAEPGETPYEVVRQRLGLAGMTESPQPPRPT